MSDNRTCPICGEISDMDKLIECEDGAVLCPGCMFYSYPSEWV